MEHSDVSVDVSRPQTNSNGGQRNQQRTDEGLSTDNDEEYDDIGTEDEDFTSSSSSESEFENYEECDCVDENPKKEDKIPYISVYETSDDAEKRGYLIPTMPVKAVIVNVEKEEDASIHLFGSYVYTIHLEHGNYKWVIKRRYKDFQHLHKLLLVYRTAQKVAAPMRRLRHRRMAIRLERTLAYNDTADGLHECTTHGHVHDNHEHNNNNSSDNLGGGKINKGLDVAELTEDVGTKPTTTTFTPSKIVDENAIDETSATPAPSTKRRNKSKSKNRRSKVYSSSRDANDGVDGEVAIPMNQRPPAVVSSGQLDSDVATTASPAMVNGGGDNDGSADSRRRRRKRQKHRFHKLPKFPYVPDSMIASENIDVRKNELQRYISGILHIPAYRNHKETALFIEVSRLSFVNNLGGKSKEGLVKKRPGGRRAFQGVSRFCIERCAKWSKRWLIVKDSFIAYIHPRSNSVRFVMLFDLDFQVKVGAENLEGIKCGLLISNLQRELLLRLESDEQAIEWKETIDRITSFRGRLWLETHQFGSSFPVRDHSYAHWFVDSKKYMEHIAAMLEIAKEEILITDWWLSPEIYLKRPMVEGNRWRLDEILKRKAQQGVRVFVLLYKEVEMALGIKSGYSKQVLQALHPNIRVLRHPDHVPGPTATMLWAHHEKLVVIDQNIAFVSGIDLCYGRWDDHCHRLVDLGSIQYQSKSSVVNIGDKRLLTGMKAMVQMFPALTMAEGDVKVMELSDRNERNVDAATAGGGSGSEVFDKTPSPLEERSPGVVLRGDDDENNVQHQKPKERSSVVFERDDNVPPKPKRIADIGRQQAAVLKFLDRGSRSRSRSPPPSDAGGGRSSTDSTNAPAPVRGWARVRRLLSVPSVSRDETQQRRSTEAPSSLLEPIRELRAKRMMSTPGERLDMADVVKMYKDYVDSGRVEKEKVKSNTPPMQRKPAKMFKVLLDIKHRFRHREDDEALGDEYDEMWSQLQAEADADFSLEGAGKYWMGKDYVNFIFKDFTDLEMPYHDFIDRSTTPRMPWHDIGSVVYGSAARDVARHFIQRWNACKIEKVKYDDSYPYLMPKSYENVQIPKIFRHMAHRCRVQVLRSGALWSCGVNHTEDSIHEAYIHLISNAKHYIYIENQFFISLIGSPEVHNKICRAVCDRIIKAHKSNETFRVYVLLPLLPGFEGSLGTTGGSALQAVLYWTYKSLSKGPYSLVACLAKEIDNYGQYLTFCSLRTHGVLCDRLVTELIYIHSKILIIDDIYCMIGSANINDRSQLGKRDSEVAVLVEDTEFETTKMNGKHYKAGKFSGSMRRHLFREHLGLLDKSGRIIRNPNLDVTDPVVDGFWNKWKDIAKRNTSIYESVFRCYPTDEVKSFEQLETYRSQIPMSEFNRPMAEEQLSRLQGSLVQFPTGFLYNSGLAPSLKSKEGLAPVSLFT